MSGPEATLERRLVDWCNKRGVFCLKLINAGGRGFPDRTLITPRGHVIFVELKSKSGQLSDNQVLWRKRLTSRSVPYLLTDNFNEAVSFVERYL